MFHSRRRSPRVGRFETLEPRTLFTAHPLSPAVDSNQSAAATLTESGAAATVAVTVLPPTSSVNPLSTQTSQTSIPVGWSGTPGSGGPIVRFNVFVSVNGGPFFTWLQDTTATSATFIGMVGNTYGFTSQAIDEAGNVEPLHTAADTSVTILPAVPAVTVTDSGGTYNGSPFPATTAPIEGVTPALSYYSGFFATGPALAGAPSAAGTYTVLASFAGSADFTSAATSATFTISRAVPTITVTDAGGRFTGLAYPATTTAPIEGIAPSLTYYTGTAAAGTALGGAPSAPGTYTVLASFSGSPDYKSAAASTTFAISELLTFEAELANPLAGEAATASAEFVSAVTATNVTSSTFAVELQGAPADDTVSVSLAGLVVGQIFTDAHGSGVLVLSSSPQPGQLPLPANFPVLLPPLPAEAPLVPSSYLAGEQTFVGLSDATGAVDLLNNFSESQPLTPDPLSPVGLITSTLTADLGVAGSTAVASVQVAQIQSDGSSLNVLRLEVDGAPGDDPLNVTIGGVSLGTITTNAAGDWSGTFGNPGSGIQLPLGWGGKYGLFYSIDPTSLLGLPEQFWNPLPAGTPVSITDAKSLDLSGTLGTSAPEPPATLLTAQLTGAGTTATASAQLTQMIGAGAVDTQFAVQVQNAPAGDSLNVTLAGVVVGQITTNASGDGELVLSSNPQAGQQSLPASFPDLVVQADAISLMDAGTFSLGGTLLPAVPPQILTAQFGGSSSGESGSVSYVHEALTSQESVTIFMVQAAGLPADATFGVQVAGVNVAQFTSSGTGAGNLYFAANSLQAAGVFPINFPGSIPPGTLVSVTNSASDTILSGALVPIPTVQVPLPPVPVGSSTALAAEVSNPASATVAAAQYSQSGAGTTIFNVEVSGAPANDTMNVRVAGVVVGAIVADVEGNGELVLSSNPVGSQQQLPANFPTSVTSGTIVVLMDDAALCLTGSLANVAVSASSLNPPVITLSDSGGTYDGSTFPATTAAIEGVTPTLSYYSGFLTTGTALAGAPTAAGTYTVLASFAGSTDFTSTAASTTFSITPATPTIVVTDTSGFETGAPFAAAATVAGVGNQSAAAASLEGVAPALTYYTGSSESGTPLSGPPSAAGTYVAVASFAGSANYASATASDAFTIKSPWHNYTNPFDVIGAGGPIRPLDALMVITCLETLGAGPLPATTLAHSPYVDVNGDGLLTPLDALLVINYLNSHSVVASSSSTVSTDALTANVASSDAAPQVLVAAAVVAGTVTSSAGTSAASVAASSVPSPAVAAGMIQPSSTASTATAPALVVSPGGAPLVASATSPATSSSTSASFASGAQASNEPTLLLSSPIRPSAVDAVLGDPLFEPDSP